MKTHQRLAGTGALQGDPRQGATLCGNLGLIAADGSTPTCPKCVHKAYVLALEFALRRAAPYLTDFLGRTDTSKPVQCRFCSERDPANRDNVSAWERMKHKDYCPISLIQE